MNNNHLVIMAGGIGSRFWPMSTPEMPKQFVDVLGVGKSLLQLTVERFSGVIPRENVWIVTSKNYKDIVTTQLDGIPREQLLLEPCMRNTAPCIAYVTYKIRKKYPNANLVFSPADHIVLEIEKFKRVIMESLVFTSFPGRIVTLGIKPTRPETGYGYIKGEVEAGAKIRKVEAFKEKPGYDLAKKYVAEECYFWNAGIFVWNVSTIISEFEKYVPELARKFAALDPVYYSSDEQTAIDKEFATCESISIDYAVMEKSERVFVYPEDFGWSDLGTWGSLYIHLEQDNHGNAIVGENVKLVDCENCVVYVPGMKKMVMQGLNDYIVAVNNNLLLVCKKEKEQEIKEWQS